MILLDANLLIYAINEDAPLNRKAKRWLESILSGNETVGFPWMVLLAFLRLTTEAWFVQAPFAGGYGVRCRSLLAESDSEHRHPSGNTAPGYSQWTCSCLWAPAEISHRMHTSLPLLSNGVRNSVPATPASPGFPA
jgi:hypothetical protein